MSQTFASNIVSQPHSNCQGNIKWFFEHLPELQQKCAEWTETFPEMFGHAVMEGELQEVAEGVWVEEVPLEVHASSAAFDHLLTQILRNMTGVCDFLTKRFYHICLKAFNVSIDSKH